MEIVLKNYIPGQWDDSYLLTIKSCDSLNNEVENKNYQIRDLSCFFCSGCANWNSDEGMYNDKFLLLFFFSSFLSMERHCCVAAYVYNKLYENLIIYSSWKRYVTKVHIHSIRNSRNRWVLWFRQYIYGYISMEIVSHLTREKGSLRIKKFTKSESTTHKLSEWFVLGKCLLTDTTQKKNCHTDMVLISMHKAKILRPRTGNYKKSNSNVEFFEHSNAKSSKWNYCLYKRS